MDERHFLLIMYKAEESQAQALPALPVSLPGMSEQLEQEHESESIRLC